MLVIFKNKIYFCSISLPEFDRLHKVAALIHGWGLKYLAVFSTLCSSNGSYESNKRVLCDFQRPKLIKPEKWNTIRFEIVFSLLFSLHPLHLFLKFWSWVSDRCEGFWSAYLSEQSESYIWLLLAAAITPTWLKYLKEVEKIIYT